MPVLYLGRNVNHISRVQFLSGFAPLLIITPTRRTKKDLTAVMVDVPVVPTTGLKGHVGNRHAHITQGAQITGPAEILPGHRVETALREQIVKFLIHIIRPLISTCRHR